MLLVLIAAHLGAFFFFALNYLRFDVGIKINDSAYVKEAEEAVSVLKNKFSKHSPSSVPVFDRFAFVLLDAWRWDFLFSSTTPMNFLKK